MRDGDGPTGLSGDRERIEALERTVRLLAEVVGDLIAACRSQMHEESFESRDYALRLALDRTEGKLDAVLSRLGVGAPLRGGEGET